MKEIKGICPIIATPFTPMGEVDIESLKNLVRTLILGGCHGVTLFGIAGEYYKLTDEERQNMAGITTQVCREHNGAAILSVTDHATEAAIKTAVRYEQLGADCLMLLPPFFLKPGEQALYDHIKAVAEAVDIPIMVQYAPAQTGVTIPVETFVKLADECTNIKYFKI